MQKYKKKLERNERALEVRFANSSFPRNLALNNQACLCLCVCPYILNLLMQTADLKGHHVKFIIDNWPEGLNKQVLKHH